MRLGLMMLDATLTHAINEAGQQHLLQFWNELTLIEQERFSTQLAGLDWNLISSFKNEALKSVSGIHEEARRALPPSHVVRIPRNDADRQAWKQARQLGEQTISAGKLGVVLLAGGQGTRLGFERSKGLFPIGPVTGQSLLEILASQVVATSKRFGRSIPYFVMTSEGTHQEIEAFYQENAYFGLDPKNVFLFHQGYAPSLDLKTGQLLLSEKGQLSMSPDGHGGLFSALWNAGLFDEMKRLGVEYLFSHQVDNPLAKVCDPEFIGLHLLHGAEVSTKVVAKTVPEEKVGVAVDVDGRTRIIEYSDLPHELAQQRDAEGGLRYWAGSTAIHLFNRTFLERVATSDNVLPWHRAIKKIPHIDMSGNRVLPESENGVKFERFIFDTLPLAEIALIVETDRDEEFAPLKNKSGDFSADYVRRQMVHRAVNWLKQHGISVPAGVNIEISPHLALCCEDLRDLRGEIAKIVFDRPAHLSPEEVLQSKSNVTDPLVFDTYLRPQVWGGRGLKQHLGRDLPEDCPYGESWDLSPLSSNVSQVIEGPLAGRDLNDLWANCRLALTGGEGPEVFPLLVKWLECLTLLSVQVHPDDQMAQRVLNEPYGKSEAWVVVSAEPTAQVFAGIKQGVTRDDFISHLNAGTLTECLHSFTPKAGDCISIPAGTIHAAGGGLIIAEVQQSSDATFRLFDWNRLGLDGKPRTLQIDRSLEAINWNQGPINPVTPVEFTVNSDGVRGERLVEGHGFIMERFTVYKSFPNPYAGEFTIWMVLEGSAELSNLKTDYHRKFNRGATTVIPASVHQAAWKSDGNRMTLMCVRLPKASK
jgi:UDP-N-acetylglucosamine/UDP-N-acetylgalactosamine diphosphorylase